MSSAMRWSATILIGLSSQLRPASAEKPATVDGPVNEAPPLSAVGIPGSEAPPQPTVDYPASELPAQSGLVANPANEAATQATTAPATEAPQTPPSAKPSPPADAPSAPVAARAEPATRRAEPHGKKTGATTGATHAAANRTGTPPTLVIGFDRLFGVYAWSAAASSGATGEAETSGTMVNGFLGSSFTNAPDGLINPFAAPRLGADWVSPVGVTAGVALGFLVASGRRTERVPTGESADIPFPTGTGFLLAPRVGFFHTIGTLAALWPRAGVTYTRLADDSGADAAHLNYLALTVEPTIAIRPVPHVVVLVSPALDIPLRGSGRVRQAGSTADLSARFSSYGAAIGTAITF